MLVIGRARTTLRALMVDLNALNPQQRLAVETTRGPVLVLAGAGTGKTRVITFRVAHLVAQGESPDSILAVTFTNKAAREMQERVRAILGKGHRTDPGKAREAGSTMGGPPKPVVCTFHSLCVRMLRRHAARIGYRPDFVIYDQGEQLGVVRRLLSQFSGPGAKADPMEVLSLLSRLRNRSASDRPIDGGMAGDLAERLLSRYQGALRACNAMDFDDLLLQGLRLLEESEEALAECRRRHRHVMVDEYQDTNAAQFRLVHALTREHRNLCVVGDDDQSIYGWRGAEAANLRDLERYYPELKVIRLEQNYRSTTTILNAANALIRNNSGRRGKNLWSQRGQGNRIRLLPFEDEEDEARSVVDEIEFARRARSIGWSRQAILFRTNIQSRPFEAALRQAGVRYHLVGGQSFFDRREIRDVIAYLKLIANPDDDTSLLRVANVPARGLSDATMEKLLAVSHQHQCSVFKAMSDPANHAAVGARAAAAMSDWVAWVTRVRNGLAGHTGPLKRWGEQVLRESGYLDELRRQEKDPEAATNRVQNVMNLVAMADDSGGNGTGLDRLRVFLEEVTLDTERESESEDPGDAVTLITMHSCKGLEFPHVYIVGLEEGILPHTKSKEAGTVEEERRLFYVAVTRAMEGLTLSHCGARKKFGQKQPAHPSRFLQELPAELVESGLERKPVTPETGRGLFAGLRAALDDL